VVVQAASRALFFEQLAESVVGEAQGLCVAVVVGEGDGSELVQWIVGVVGAAIVGDFGDQPAVCYPERLAVRFTWAFIGCTRYCKTRLDYLLSRIDPGLWIFFRIMIY